MIDNFLNWNIFSDDKGGIYKNVSYVVHNYSAQKGEVTEKGCR